MSHRPHYYLVYGFVDNKNETEFSSQLLTVDAIKSLKNKDTDELWDIFDENENYPNIKKGYDCDSSFSFGVHIELNDPYENSYINKSIYDIKAAFKKYKTQCKFVKSVLKEVNIKSRYYLVCFWS